MAEFDEPTRPAAWEDVLDLAKRLDAIDVMASACGHDWQELAPMIEEREVDGQRLRVMGLRGLLLTKEGMREKDRADARVLRLLIEKDR